MNYNISQVENGLTNNLQTKRSLFQPPQGCPTVATTNSDQMSQTPYASPKMQYMRTVSYPRAEAMASTAINKSCSVDYPDNRHIDRDSKTGYSTQLLSYNQFSSDRDHRYWSKIAWIIDWATLMNWGGIVMLPVTRKHTSLKRFVEQFSQWNYYIFSNLPQKPGRKVTRTNCLLHIQGTQQRIYSGCRNCRKSETRITI